MYHLLLFFSFFVVLFSASPSPPLLAANITNRTKKVEDLESRVAALEEGAKYDATQELIRQREVEFLQQLREIRATMVQEQKSGVGGANVAELESLKSENARLKSVIAKQEYRIKHLISGFEKLMEEKETR